MNDARAAYIGHQPADKDKCFPWPTRTHTHTSKYPNNNSRRAVRAREATLLNSREQQRRFFSLDYSASERQQGNNTKPRASCVLTKCFVCAASCHPGVSVAEMKQTLAQLYSYFDRPRNKTIIKSKLKNSRCRHLAQHTAANLLGGVSWIHSPVCQRIIPREFTQTRRGRLLQTAWGVCVLGSCK